MVTHPTSPRLKLLAQILVTEHLGAPTFAITNTFGKPNHRKVLKLYSEYNFYKKNYKYYSLYI